MAPSDEIRPPEGKRATDILAPLLGIQLALRTGGYGPREHVGPHGHPPGAADTPGEQKRLIETPFALSSGMKRHGNQEIGVCDSQSPLPHLDQKVAQRSGEGSAAPELERVQCLAQDAAVAGGRPRIAERGRAPPALAAAVPRRTGAGRRRITRRELRNGQSADPAPGRSQALHAAPAGATERIAPVGAEPGPADRAEGREHEVEQRGGPGPPGRRDPWLGYGREVFQRRHDAHRSTHPEWEAPHAEQRCGHFMLSLHPSARRYSSNASRAWPRRSNTAPRNAWITGWSGARTSIFSNCSAASSSIASSRYARPRPKATARLSGCRAAAPS